MDLIFAIAYHEKVSPVAVSLRKDLPIAGTPEADKILGIKRTVPHDNEKAEVQTASE